MIILFIFCLFLFPLCVRHEHAKEASSFVPSLCGAEDYKRDFYRVAKRSSAAAASQENTRDAYNEKVRGWNICITLYV